MKKINNHTDYAIIVGTKHKTFENAKKAFASYWMMKEVYGNHRDAYFQIANYVNTKQGRVATIKKICLHDGKMETVTFTMK